ncbi:MAG: hypothetical protein ALAOOOJD_02197 [bacterium]|nr:hypothetical protein [bacterium]
MEGDDSSYAEYSVALQKLESFEEFNCQARTNVNLTLKILFSAFAEMLKSSFDKTAYLVIESEFHKRIEFEIEKTSYGSKIIVLSPYYLKSTKTYGFLLDYRFRKLENVAFSSEIQRLSLSLDRNYKSNRNFYSDKYFILESFLNESLHKFSPFESNGLLFSLSGELKQLKEERLEKKRYIFRNNMEGNSQFQGVRQFGVLKSIEQKITYIFIFEDKFKAFANELYLSLLGKTNPGTFSGMQQMFRLNFSKDDVKKIELKDYKEITLFNAIEEIKKIRNADETKKVVGIFIEPARDESIPASKSPYYILKYYSTLEAIPLQCVNYEKMNTNHALKWSTSNIGLQIFAKCGGIPWKLKPTNENCLILGIGSAHEKNSDGKIKKYFAYTVCLDSSGIYHKLEVLAEDKDRDTYLSKFEKKLFDIVNNHEKKNYQKCALHLPFKIKRKEIKSIRNVIRRISGVEFKVLKINTEHRFFGFSAHNTYVPYESSFIRLSHNEYLVWFDGLNYGKENVYQKIGNPIHVEFLDTDVNNDNQFENLSYLQDVINLSGANWRGFNSKQIPISIYYSKLLAEYTRAFKHFPGFDEKMFLNTLPWFL